MVVEKRFSILFIPTGDRRAPATRYRICQYLPFLEKEGIEYKIYSIISDNMTIQMIKSPMFNKLEKIIYYIRIVIEKFIRTWKIILLAGDFDLVFLQRATFPIGLERFLRLKNKNIIFDIDDSIYMPDRKEKGILGWIKKLMKKREVESILRVSKCVIVENSHIKNFVQQYCKKVYLITGPIDSVRNYPREYKHDSNKITIGWIGSPSTTIYLRMLDEVLKQLSKKCKIKVRLIGASFYSMDGVEVEMVNWSEETEVSELHKFDIGVMPMPDNEWTRGKVGCKMLQYMANGIPAVVSFTSTNAEIIEDGKNGFLARSEGEWIEKLSLLIENPNLREKIGLAGRKTVEERFSVEVNTPKYLEILKRIREKQYQ